MKKKFITKVVGVALATLTIFTLCFTKTNNVKASAVNDYQDENYWFQGATEYTGINDINDLKGKTFTLSFSNISDLLSFPSALDFFINISERDYIGIEIDEETHETIQCVDYLQYPYLIYEYIDNYGNKTFNLFSFYSESSDNYSFIYVNDTPLNTRTKIQFKGSLTSQINNFAYLPVDNIDERYDVPLGYYEIVNFEGIHYTRNVSNFFFETEENFLNNVDTYSISFRFLNFYFIFPNTDRYSLEISIPNALSVFENYVYIQPYNANIEDQILQRIEGYNLGYSAGIAEGATSGIFSIFTGVISSVNDILQIEIFPNVKLGYFIWLPLTLGIVSLILVFWRKD